jgi:GT2 family glycosyltransferase
VIPAYDAEPSIGAVVSSLKGDSPSQDVLVVDDGSTDATAVQAEAAGARVLRLDRRGGPARARNRGVEASPDAQVIVFTDADCRARPGFVARLLEPLERDPTLVGTKGAYVTAQRGLVPRFVQLEYEERYARMERRREIDFVDTYACAYRREALVAAGGFDERYDRPSTEDQELSFRLHERGARFLFVSEARTEHTHADSLRAYLRKKAKIGYFKAATLRAHPKKALDDAHTPATVKLQVAIAPAALVGGGVLATVAAVELAYAVATGGGFASVPRALLLDLATPLVACSGLAVAAFLTLSVPLSLRALASDPLLAPFVPALSLGRGLALGAGLAVGATRELFGQGVLDAAPEPARRA